MCMQMHNYNTIFCAIFPIIFLYSTETYLKEGANGYSMSRSHQAKLIYFDCSFDFDLHVYL